MAQNGDWEKEGREPALGKGGNLDITISRFADDEFLLRVLAKMQGTYCSVPQ